MSNFLPIVPTYRSLLRQIRLLPHAYLRQFYRIKVRQYFRRNICTNLHWPRHVAAKLKKSRKELRLLVRANNGERNAFHHVLDIAYGRKGKLKHDLMARYLTNPFGPQPPRIIPAVERSRPPSYSPELATLLTSIHARTRTKPLKPAALHTPPTLPERANPQSEEALLVGPFSLRREVNIRWRYHTHEISKTQFPLELTNRNSMDSDSDPSPSLVRGTGAEQLQLLEEVERLARSPHDGVPIPRRQRRSSLTPEPPQPFQPEFDSPLPIRFIRRRYRELLSRIPILIPKKEAKTGCITALSPLAISNATRGYRLARATEEDVGWIIKAITLDGKEKEQDEKKIERKKEKLIH